MIVHKSRGQQLLKVVRRNVSGPIFLHGQQFISFSRVGIDGKVCILVPVGKINNIAFPEALN